MNGCWELGKAAELASVVVIVGTFWWLKKKLCCVCVCVCVPAWGREWSWYREKRYRLWRQANLVLDLSLIVDLMYESR